MPPEDANTAPAAGDAVSEITGIVLKLASRVGVPEHATPLLRQLAELGIRAVLNNNDASKALDAVRKVLAAKDAILAAVGAE